MEPTGTLTRAFIWLSGASEENLRPCPPWERRKFVALGATVLVPCLFALIASSYAVHTLTDNRVVIAAVAVAWAFIILTVDRALVSTYRAYQSNIRKLGQFSLRIVVAALMGLTISHPLTLLLFRDTISSFIEKDREAEIAAVRAAFSEQREIAEDKIGALQGQIAAFQEQWGATFAAGFRAGEEDSKRSAGEDSAAAAELEKSIDEARRPTTGKIEAAEKEITSLTGQSTKLQGELDFWQKEFERELNGQRSGIVGLGPRARSIQSDQLEWRRTESRRLAGLLQEKTKERNRLQTEAAGIEQDLQGRYRSEAARQAARQREEQERLDRLNRQLQEGQVDQFVDYQSRFRTTLRTQIDSHLEQVRQAQIDLPQLSDEEKARISVIRAEPRRDLLRQTLALRHLFHDVAQGGRFALTTYLVLSLLFMLVDTIPLVLRFFTKSGPYDALVDCDEVRFDRERNAFLKSYNRYMDELSNGRLLHLTRNKPLEQALIEGVDRSRAAKEFLESLLDLENTFQDRVRRERDAMTGPEAHIQPHARTAMLQQMADAFYKDLRERMERFFTDANPSQAG